MYACTPRDEAGAIVTSTALGRVAASVAAFPVASEAERPQKASGRIMASAINDSAINIMFRAGNDVGI